MSPLRKQGSTAQKLDSYFRRDILLFPEQELINRFVFVSLICGAGCVKCLAGAAHKKTARRSAVLEVPKIGVFLTQSDITRNREK